jgi:DNA-binding NarL/FixJ family response regulator
MVNHATATSVLLVEDDAVHGAHITEAVRRVPNTRIVGWMRTGAALREQVSGGAVPDLVLMDLGLPDASGLDLVRELQGTWPSTKVLVLSVMTDERNVIEAIRRGAAGYVVKDGNAEAISSAIQSALEGHTPISPSVARYLVDYLRGKIRPLVASEDAPKLTRRELDILNRIAEGLSYQEAADALEVSRSTVEVHIRNLYKKLQVHSKTQALASARRHGLL